VQEADDDMYPYAFRRRVLRNDAGVVTVNARIQNCNDKVCVYPGVQRVIARQTQTSDTLSTRRRVRDVKTTSPIIANTWGV
jgi:hypothetical protein